MHKVIRVVVAFLSLFCVAASSTQAGAEHLAPDATEPRTAELSVFTRQFDAVKRMSLADLVGYTTQILADQPTLADQPPLADKPPPTDQPTLTDRPPLSPHEKLCVLGEFCSRLMPGGKRAGLLYLFSQISHCMRDSTSDAADPAAQQLFDAFLLLLDTVAKRSSVVCGGEGSSSALCQVVAFCKYVRAVQLLGREVQLAYCNVTFDDPSRKQDADSVVEYLRRVEVLSFPEDDRLRRDGPQSGFQYNCYLPQVENLIRGLERCLSAEEFGKLRECVGPFVAQVRAAAGEVDKLLSRRSSSIPFASFYTLDLAFGVLAQNVCFGVGRAAPVRVRRNAECDSYWKKFWALVGNVRQFGGQQLRLKEELGWLRQWETADHCHISLCPSSIGEIVKGVDIHLRPGFGTAFFGMDSQFALEMPETGGSTGVYTNPCNADQALASLLCAAEPVDQQRVLTALMGGRSGQIDPVAAGTAAWRSRRDRGFDTSVLWCFTNILFSSKSTPEMSQAILGCSEWLLKYFVTYGDRWALQMPEVVVAFELLHAHCTTNAAECELRWRGSHPFHAGLPTVMHYMLTQDRVDFCEQLVTLLCYFPTKIGFPVGKDANDDLKELAVEKKCTPLVAFLADAPAVSPEGFSVVPEFASRFELDANIAEQYEAAGGDAGLVLACSNCGQLALFFEKVFPKGWVGHEAAALNLLAHALHGFTFRKPRDRTFDPRPTQPAGSGYRDDGPVHVLFNMLVCGTDCLMPSRARAEFAYANALGKYEAAAAEARAKAAVGAGGPSGVSHGGPVAQTAAAGSNRTRPGPPAAPGLGHGAAPLSVATVRGRGCSGARRPKIVPPASGSGVVTSTRPAPSASPQPPPIQYADTPASPQPPPLAAADPPASVVLPPRPAAAPPASVVLPSRPAELPSAQSHDFLSHVFKFWFPKTEAEAAGALAALSSLSDDSKRLLGAYTALREMHMFAGLQGLYALLDKSEGLRQYYFSFFQKICRRFPLLPDEFAYKESEHWAKCCGSVGGTTYHDHLYMWLASFVREPAKTSLVLMKEPLRDPLIGDVMMDGLQPIVVHFLDGRPPRAIYSLASITEADRPFVCKLVFHQGVDFSQGFSNASGCHYETLRSAFPFLTSVFFLGRVVALPDDADYGEYSMHVGYFPRYRTEWIEPSRGRAWFSFFPPDKEEKLFPGLDIRASRADLWTARWGVQISSCQTSEHFVNAVTWNGLCHGTVRVREGSGVALSPVQRLVRGLDDFGKLYLARNLVSGVFTSNSGDFVWCLPSFPFSWSDRNPGRYEPLYVSDSFFGIGLPVHGDWKNDVLPRRVGHFSDTQSYVPISFADSVEVLGFLAKFSGTSANQKWLARYAPSSFLERLVKFLGVDPAICGWSLAGSREISWDKVARQLYAHPKLAQLSEAAKRVASEYLALCGSCRRVFIASPDDAELGAAKASWSAWKHVTDPGCIQKLTSPFQITVSDDPKAGLLVLEKPSLALDSDPFLVSAWCAVPTWSASQDKPEYVGVKALGLGALLKVIRELALDFASDDFTRPALFALVLRNLGLHVALQPQMVAEMSEGWSSVYGAPAPVAAS